MNLDKYMALALFLLIMFCSCISNKIEYRYFSLKSSSYIEKTTYLNNKVIDNLIIKTQFGSINVLAIPFTEAEYEENLRRRLSKTRGKGEPTYFDLKINGRKIKALRKSMDKANCYIFFSDYFMGIAFYYTYFGACNTQPLQYVLNGIIYQIDVQKVTRARQDFLRVMRKIERLYIPIYPSSRNVKSVYSISMLGRTIKYEIISKPNSRKILEFYKSYFLRLGWTPSDLRHFGHWYRDKLFFTWTDRSKEIMVRLLLFQKRTSFQSPTNIAVYIDMTPYLITEWE